MRRDLAAPLGEDRFEVAQGVIVGVERIGLCGRQRGRLRHGGGHDAAQ
jgi:hypothetical protein